jgi:predicted ribosomally synthesized peptide with nif11-like leader
MSVYQAKAFIKRMKSDIAFRKRVLSLENVEAKIKFINSEGFICTEDDIRLAELEAHSANGMQRGGYWFPYSFYTRHHLWMGD